MANSKKQVFFNNFEGIHVGEIWSISLEEDGSEEFVVRGFGVDGLDGDKCVIVYRHDDADQHLSYVVPLWHFEKHAKKTRKAISKLATSIQYDDGDFTGRTLYVTLDKSQYPRSPIAPLPEPPVQKPSKPIKKKASQTNVFVENLFDDMPDGWSVKKVGDYFVLLDPVGREKYRADNLKQLASGSEDKYLELWEEKNHLEQRAKNLRLELELVEKEIRNLSE